MSENLDTILETNPRNDSGQPQFRSANLTLSVLRFVGGASLILGIIVCVLAFLLFLVASNNPSSSRDAAGISFLVAVGALAQGFIIYALFNALALIVENLIAIRENLTRTSNKT